MSFWDKASKMGAKAGKAIVEEGKKTASYMSKVNKMSEEELLEEHRKRLSPGEKKIVEAQLRVKGLL